MGVGSSTVLNAPLVRVPEVTWLPAMKFCALVEMRFHKANVRAVASPLPGTHCRYPYSQAIWPDTENIDPVSHPPEVDVTFAGGWVPDEPTPGRPAAPSMRLSRVI